MLSDPYFRICKVRIILIPSSQGGVGSNQVTHRTFSAHSLPHLICSTNFSDDDHDKLHLGGVCSFLMNTNYLVEERWENIFGKGETSHLTEIKRQRYRVGRLKGKSLDSYSKSISQSVGQGSPAFDLEVLHGAVVQSADLVAHLPPIW